MAVSTEDADIIELFFKRSQRAVAELDGKYGKLIFQISNNILNNAEDASECVNDTYLGVWNTIPPTKPESLIHYVCRLARNISLTRFRDAHAQKRSAVFVALDELENYIPDWSLEEQVAVWQLGQTIDAFLDTLDQRSRLAFLYRYWMGDSVQVIAETLGISSNNVSIRLSRTRKKLKDYLKKEGYYDEPKKG